MNPHRLPLMVAALWWGAVSGISFVAVPLMFAHLGPAVAGPLAAKLFSLQCWMALGFGLLVLLMLRRQRAAALTALGSPQLSGHILAEMRSVLGTMAIVVVAMLVAMVQEFGVAHQIVSARATGGNLRLWHGLGSALVLCQWLCAGAVLWRLTRVGRRQMVENQY